jgi:hypothetical protein
MNNWDYISTFYKWLYTLGVRLHDDPRYFLNQNRLVKNDFRVADPADCNNIYLWFIERNSTDSANNVNPFENTKEYMEILKPIKDLTHEPVFLRGVPVNFRICAAPEAETRDYLQNNVPKESSDNFFKRSYLEVTLDDDALYSSSTISKQIASKIITYFSSENQRLGQYVDFNNLMDLILQIDGINRIRTVYVPLDENFREDPNNAIIYNGICMASYSLGVDGLIDIGADLEVSNSSRSLEQFQYGTIESHEGFIDSIKVIKKSVNSMNKVQY